MHGLQHASSVLYSRQEGRKEGNRELPGILDLKAQMNGPPEVNNRIMKLVESCTSESRRIPSSKGFGIMWAEKVKVLSPLVILLALRAW